MRYLRPCTIVVFVLLATADKCTAQEDDIPEVNVIGAWKWISTTGGSRGKHTPKADGYTAVLRFKKNGEFEYYRNGTKQVSGRYKLGRTEGSRMVEFDKGFQFVNKYAYVYVWKGKLTLDGSYEANGHNSVYQKLPDSDPLPMDQP